MYLRNRIRAFTGKQALMADHHSTQSSPTQNYKKPIPSFFDSLKFRAFATKLCLSETDALISPTSLDTKLYGPFASPFSFDRDQPKTPKIFSPNKHSPKHNSDTKAVGLALVYTLNDETIEKNSSKASKPEMLFSTKLRVQILPLPFSPTKLPNSQDDFGIKMKNTRSVTDPDWESGIKAEDSTRVSAGFISVSEMKLSEEYTCVISHGPNPRTTHIFDNHVLESYFSFSEKSNSAYTRDFLSFCHTCKKTLDQNHDIYIYRGEKAFCSSECRYKEMMLDGLETCEFD